MISSFWNLCRACPSVPVEKLHSEYRSTFQWHEYVGSNAKPSASSGLSSHHAVVRQPTTAQTQAQAFWSGGQGEDTERRGGKRVNISNINNSVNGGGGSWWVLKSSSEGLRSKSPAAVAVQQFTKGRPKFETQLPAAEEDGGTPRKSLSMGTIRAPPDSFPTQTHLQATSHVNLTSQNIANDNASDNVGVSGGIDKPKDTMEWSEHRTEQMSHSYEGPSSSHLEDAKQKRKEYKSEYKKQFKPFSQYGYVDGKFFKKKGEQDLGNPWYKEVIELRKKAGEYRHRGWGTELVPQHLADVYHQNLWDQVSRRSSLAALALITTTTQRTTSKEEKDKENARKSMPKRPLSRPNTATPKHPMSDFRIRESEAVHGAKTKYDGPPSSASSRASRGQARSQSAGPGGRSPRKSAAHSVLSKERDLNKPSQPRHPRPSSADPSLGFSEPIIKSPPEPTRVKSPEQVILRSPDPVNWTVPLDTTKSFTVTQNIRDAPPSPRFRAGERLESRSGSTKASSPMSSYFSPRTKPPGSGQSQSTRGSGGSVNKPQSNKNSIGSDKSPNAHSSTTPGLDKTKGSKTNTTTPPNLNGCKGASAQKLGNRSPDDNKNNNGSSAITVPKARALPPSGNNTTIGKPVPGTNLQCLDDPQFKFDPQVTTQPGQLPISRPNASVVATHTTAGPDNARTDLKGKAGGIKVLEAPSSVF